MHLSDSRLQVTEIYQATGNRQASFGFICQVLPAKSLPSVTCYLLHNSKGVV